MLVEVTFVRDARSVTQITPETVIEPDNVVAGAFIREPRAIFATGVIAGGAGGVSDFLALTDTPDSYAGQAGKLVGVIPEETGLDFVLPPPSVAGSYLIDGGGVAWIGPSGFSFRVSAAEYVIGGNVYFSPQTVVTLTAADPTNDRIDVIAVDDTSTVVVITGTPSATPVEPPIDPATQLKLTFIYVPAGSSSPAITREDLYQENTEWTSSTNTGNINPASTNNPFAGTVDIEGTATVNGNRVQLVRPTGTVVVGNYEIFVMQIRSKAAWPNQKSIQLYWMHGATNIGVSVTVKDGTFGFDSSNTTGYQQIVIPISAFQVGSYQCDTFRAVVTGGAGPIGWYIDNVSIQGGVPHGKSGGDFSTNTNLSVVGELVEFADVTGKLGRRTSGTGLATVASGVLTKVPYPGQGGKIAAVKTDESGMEFIPAPTPVVVTVKHNFTFDFRKTSGLVTGKLPGYWTCPFSGTITGWNITLDTGTITLKVWKKATGTAKPTSADSINTSGISLSTGTNVRSVTLTDFTTLAVAAGDIFAAEITAVGGGVTDFGGSIEITQT
jgi:hypothetical protein